MGRSKLLQQPEQVLTIVVLTQIGSQLAKLIAANETHPVRHFFRTSDHQPLSFFHRLDEICSLEEIFVAASKEAKR